MFEISLSRGYNEVSFREDLKALYSKLGMENKKVVFLMTDQHVVEEGWWGKEGGRKEMKVGVGEEKENGKCRKLVRWFFLTTTTTTNPGFLELTNNMLTSGMVPALFGEDEKEQIIGQVW